MSTRFFLLKKKKKKNWRNTIKPTAMEVGVDDFAGTYPILACFEIKDFFLLMKPLIT